jgi:preprotein translocase subunit YajC
MQDLARGEGEEMAFYFVLLLLLFWFLLLLPQTAVVRRHGRRHLGWIFVPVVFVLF